MDDFKPPSTGPFSPAEWWSIVWVTVVSLVGGVGSFLRKVRQGHATMFNVMEFIGELFVAALVGIVTYWVCRGMAIDPFITAALVGVCSHMGTRMMYVFEQWVKRKGEAFLDKWTGIK